MSDRNTDLPPGLDLLWGLREQGRRGPRPNLSVEQIVDAALDIAATEGLAALSMSRVAERLDRTAMSLYRYVRNKDELLQLMVDVMAANDGPPEASLDVGWRSNLERWCAGLLGLYQRHRWALNLPVSATPPIGPGQLAWLDRGLACLRDTPLPYEVRLGVVMLLLTYIRGEVRLTQEVNQVWVGAEDPAHPQPPYGQVLRRLVRADRFPALDEVVRSGVFDGPDAGISDAEFDEQITFGLAMILDGVEKLIGDVGGRADPPSS